MSLRDRIQLVDRPAWWLNKQAADHHYMHRPVSPLACPFGWGVTLDGMDTLPDGKPAGFIIFSTVHFTKLKGEFGYEGLPTQWQVLHLARLWLHDLLPHNSETCVMGKAHRMVQRRWLEVHPPRFPEQPYHILKIISWADLRYHRGTVYIAANYRIAGETVGAPRHRRGDGVADDSPQMAMFDVPTTDQGGTEEERRLRCFILDLPAPRWEWTPPVKAQLSMFEEYLACGVEVGS